MTGTIQNDVDPRRRRTTRAPELVKRAVFGVHDRRR